MILRLTLFLLAVKVASSQFNADQQKACVDHLNLLRANTPASNMMAVSWNAQLADRAFNDVGSCRYSPVPSSPDVGMMIYSGTGQMKIELILSNYYEQVTNYTYSTNQCRQGQNCEVYKQMVYAETTAIGCANITCPAIESSTGTILLRNAELLICYFSPKSNPNVQPYQAGQSCTQCPPGTICNTQSLCQQGSGGGNQVGPSWGGWTLWSTCDKTCGTGQQTRSRQCPGTGCVGLPMEVRQCQRMPCGDYWGNWIGWTTCSPTCGPGKQYRFRQCLGQNGSGTNCIGSSLESQDCQTAQLCPIIAWEPWSGYTACTRSCGGGTRSRFRICPQTNACQGSAFESATCNTQACPVWGSWGNYGPCSVTCGSGSETRTRSCISGNCIGSRSETRPCTRSVCPGIWSVWGPYTTCTVTCGAGSRARTRSCSVANTCAGLSTDTVPCTMPACPLNWNPWGLYSGCTVSCGTGTQTRTRSCPMVGQCTGSPSQVRTCNPGACATWAAWGSFGQCSATCGGGTQMRTRVCNGGNNCPGSSTSTQPCNSQACPEWGAWQPMGTCSATCGGGDQTYQRTCPVANACLGGAFTIRRCNTNSCPQPVWANWNIPACPVTCGGSRIRVTRSCLSGNCVGATFEDRDCNTSPCPVGVWSNWNTPACPVSCGGSRIRVTRSCTGGGNCVGSSFEDRDCNTNSCPITATWGPWGFFTNCPVTCGGGTVTRTRVCIGGGQCTGVATESQACNTQVCPVITVGTWSSWTPSTTCTVTCGGGTQTAVRSCISGSCTGPTTQLQTCNTQACTGNPSTNEIWSNWSAFTACSVSCGGGIQARVRTCISPAGCTPPAVIQTQPCNPQACTAFASAHATDPTDRWSDWSACSVTCGTGWMYRFGPCKTTACKQRDYKIEPCQKIPCDRALVGFSEWGPWRANRDCGVAEYKRERKCTVPYCTGLKTHTVLGFDKSCPGVPPGCLGSPYSCN